MIGLSTQLREHELTAVDGTRLHAVSVGPRWPHGALVLVHGYTQAVGFWERQLAALSDELLVIAYDQRGHGRSARPGPAGISVLSLGCDLGTVVDALVPTGLPTVLAGHSLGGAALLGWAQHERRSGSVRALALINTSSHHIPQGAAAFLPPPLAHAFVRVFFPLLCAPVAIPAAAAPLVERLA